MRWLFEWLYCPYALLWMVVVGARLWFGYAANHTFPVQLGTWMFTHQLTSSLLADAFIFLALAMVLTRTGSLALRSRRAARHPVRRARRRWTRPTRPRPWATLTASWQTCPRPAPARSTAPRLARR